VPVLVLGLTYRHGVHELAYSRALPLIERLAHAGAIVSAYDPLLTPDETARHAAPWTWGTPGPFRAIVTQTADPQFRTLDPAWFPALEVLFDGRDSLRDLALPARVTYRGIGVPARAGSAAARPA
jgi:UDP-N-acetyl-D-mannosaminuronate dehydrogenase